MGYICLETLECDRFNVLNKCNACLKIPNSIHNTLVVHRIFGMFHYYLVKKWNNFIKNEVLNY